MRNRILNTIVYLFGAVVVVSSLIACVQEFPELSRWRDTGDMRSTIFRNPETDVLLFRLVSELDVAEGMVPSTGDTVLTFDGFAATKAIRDSLFIGPREPGTAVIVEFRHEGKNEVSTFVMDRPARGDYLLAFLLLILKYVLNLAFLSVGVIALIQQPNSGAARMLILFNFSMAAMIVNSLDLVADSFAPPAMTYWKDITESILEALIPLLAVFWLGLQTLFPKPIRLMQKAPALVYGLLFVPMLLMIYVVTMGWIHFNPVKFLIAGYVGAGFALLGYNVAKTKNPLQKRQAKMVYFGTAFGLAPLFTMILVFVLFPNLSQILGMQFVLLLLMVLFLALLAIPITYLVAFNRYGLLEIEAKIRRGTRYLLITGALLGLLFAVVFGVSELFARGLGVTARTPVLILSVVLAVGVTPAQRRLQTWLDRRFFPERFNLSTLLEEFLQRAPSFPDRETLWSNLADELKVGLNVKVVLPLQRAKTGGFETLQHLPVPISLDGDFYNTMLKERKPILLDEALQSEHVRFTDEELSWLRDNGIEVVVPIVASSVIQGIVTLGGRLGDEPYRAEEVRILANLARQVALSSENLSLLEENVEKKRLEEQLAVARSIQEGFLPATIPATPGIEMAATSLFCLEVAGDYYDVISMPGGRTLFAVGDVSGKGAGAAMIMANLQASLRALVRVEVPLTEMVAGINDLIHHNTPPEDYITFFVGVYDPQRSSITYVNAGHNPPFVFRKGGGMELLEEGGVVLGSIPGMPYEQGEVILHEEDLLLLFTDGVTEAMNESEEEYGEERLAGVLLEQFSSPVEDLLCTIRERVIDFSGEAHFDDDFTLLVLRCKGGTPSAVVLTGSGEE